MRNSKPLQAGVVDLMNRLGAARLAAALNRLEWGALSPGTLPGWLPLLVALLPPLGAGILLFRLPAAQILAIAIVVAVAAQVAAVPLRVRTTLPVGVPVLVGVALVGAGAPLPVVAGIAAAAAGLELARARFLPGVRISTGVLAYAAFAIALPAAAYVRPITLRPEIDPIGLWLRYFGGPGAPFDPISLYVGNVAGPVFATSLLAVAVGAAWLWYTRRLQLAVLVGFLAAGLAESLAHGWNPVFQLDSGPTWFLVVFVLGDLSAQRHTAPVQALSGAVAGLAMVGLRARGVGLEALPWSVLGVQAALLLGEGCGWVLARPQVRSRLASLTEVTRHLRPRWRPTRVAQEK